MMIHSAPPVSLAAGGGDSEGHQWSLQWSDDRGARHTGSRDSCLHDHQTPRLCHPGSQNRCLQPAQGDQEDLFWFVIPPAHNTTSLSLSPPPSLPEVVMKDLYEYRNPHNGKHSPMVSKELLDIVTEHADVSCFFESAIFTLILCLSLSPASEFSHHLRQGLWLQLFWFQGQSTFTAAVLWAGGETLAHRRLLFPGPR